MVFSTRGEVLHVEDEKDIMKHTELRVKVVHLQTLYSGTEKRAKM